MRPDPCPRVDAAVTENEAALDVLRQAIVSSEACACEADQQHLRSAGAILEEIAAKSESVVKKVEP